MVDKLIELGSKKELMGKLKTVLPQLTRPEKTFAFAKNPNFRGVDVNSYRLTK